MNYKWTNLNSLLRKKKFRPSLNASLNHLNRSVKQRKISRRLTYIFRHVTVDLKLIVRSYKDHIGNLELYKLLKLDTIEISWKENTGKKIKIFFLAWIEQNLSYLSRCKEDFSAYDKFQSCHFQNIRKNCFSCMWQRYKTIKWSEFLGGSSSIFKPKGLSYFNWLSIEFNQYIEQNIHKR